MDLRSLAVLMMVNHMLASADPGCDQAQFLTSNGSCLECPTCGPGQQLSEDCGYGDGGGGHCEACGEGEFSVETSVSPCWQCTQCILLNRMERQSCTPTTNAVCGACLRGFYELRRKNGEVEPLCMPCLTPSGGIRRDCLPPSTRADKAGLTTVPRTRQKEDSRRRVESIPVSVAVIGSASAASAFMLVLMLWLLLLTVERLDRGLRLITGPRGTKTLLPCATPRAIPITPSENQEMERQDSNTEDTPRNDTNLEKDIHPPSIVINVTTNIKPVNQGGGGDCEWEGPEETQPSLKEMELKLQDICTKTAGHSLEDLDYDTVHDLSLLLDAGVRGGCVRRLGHALGVPPEILGNVRSFQELFQYLRTSTSTVLPQLARAVASLPCPDAVARMHLGLLTGQNADDSARTTRMGWS